MIAAFPIDLLTQRGVGFSLRFGEIHAMFPLHRHRGSEAELFLFATKIQRIRRNPKTLYGILCYKTDEGICTFDS